MNKSDVDAVILAAGLSSRAGSNKLKFDIGGKTLISRCIEPFYDICSKVIVVCGHNFAEVKSLLTAFPEVQVVENKEYMNGMFSSVKTGIKMVTAPRFFLTPGDHPFIDSEVLDSLLKETGEVIIPSTNNRKGHPVLIDSKLINGIIMENEDSNLKNFLRQKTQNIVNVNNIGILIDIDTVEDYNLALRQYENFKNENK